MKSPFRISLAAPALALMLGCGSSVVEAQDGAAFYREKIHPIFEANCFKCHGAPGERLKSDFRLTNRADLLRGGDLGSSLNEAEPAKSLLLAMVSYKDDEHQMPPKAKLPAEEIALLEQWAEMGAPYDPALEIAGDPSERHGFSITDEDRQWWAYQPVKRPTVADDDAIDTLLRRKLAEKDLDLAPRASRETLVRRACYDLHGLPPTPEKVADFIADPRSDEEAFAALIDELLAQPEYGEKWARHWLDLARYAETNGFERDNAKPEIWKYRDYVVTAFNEDKPYDQFVLEQLAGDEIPEPTHASITATGFHRLMQWDDEPSDGKQHRYDVLADNVQMITETLLGTTVGCARCHDHKADPISHADYYSFMAFLHGVQHYNTAGTIVYYAEPGERERLEKERRARLAALETRRQSLEQEIEVILTKSGRMGSPDGPAGPAPKILVRGAQDAGATGNWWHVTRKPTDDWADVGFKDKSWIKTPKSGFGRRGVPNNPNVNVTWTSSDIWVRTEFGLKDLPPALVLDLYHDEDVEVYLNGALVHEADGYVADYQSIDLGKKGLAAIQTGKNVLAFHCRQTGGGQYVDMTLKTGHGGGGGAKNVQDALRAGGGKVRNEIKEAAGGRDLVQEWEQTRRDLEQANRKKAGEPINAVTERGADGGQLHVHLRGSAHALGEEVVPAFLTVLGGEDGPIPAEFAPVETLSGQTSGRRLALAKWIVAPENPLTARVIMNRLWQHHFGRGIAPSTSDFGRLGELPSHPELLDWLASELPRQGWSLKAMHRLVMNSEAYVQSSAPIEEALAVDPANVLLWRFPMRRLTAEEMRDSLLFVNGRLNLEKKGGPWVYPPLPKEVLATSSKPNGVWPVSKDPADHLRRSLYIHVKRSLRHPMMADFDQADTDSHCAVRFVTTVPTQALAMLNSGFVNDQAAHFAKRLQKEHPGDLKAQVERGILLVTQRKSTPDEIKVITDFAASIAKEGSLNETDTLERVALLLLNLNEFIYLD